MVEFLKKIDQLLKKVLEETLKIESEKSDCQRFYYQVLYMNIRSCEGAIFLLSNFKKKPLLQIPFVSVMRDLISNLILVEYISYKENDPSSNISLELEKIYSEHYRFERKQKKIENTLFGSFDNHAKFEKEFDKLGEKYLDDDGELKSHLKKVPSTYGRIKYIESRQNKDEKDNVRVLYQWYSEFSKISHFGELTIKQVVRKYISKNEEEVFENYNYLFKVVSTSIVGLLVKVSFDEPVEESIGEDLGEIWNFENGT